MKTLIHNGTIVDSGKTFRGWITIANQLIEQVGEGDYEGEFRGTIVDAAGCLVLPGAIDDHVHFREPGLTWKGDIASESRAAVAGGVTSVIDMPNTNPPTISLADLERKIEIGAVSSTVNYAFWFGATADNLEEVKRLDPRMTAGVKVFMGSSTGGMLLNDQRILSAIFAESPVLVGVHCEDETMIREAADKIRSQYGDNVTAAMHPLVRSAEACYKSSARAVELADKYGTNLHVLHVSTARELSLFDAGPIYEKKITAEACVNHLWFSDEDYYRLDNLIKINPAIKTPADRKALREGILAGKIDIVATDHAPHTIDEKQQLYWTAPSGAPGVQHSLCSMLSIFEPEVVVQKMCHAPAIRFGVRERGFLRPGMFADIAIVAKEEQIVGKPLYKCDWSPQEGDSLAYTVRKTFVNGHLVYDNGIIDDDFRGKPLEFTRN